MAFTHFTQHAHSGFVKSMAEIPCHSKQCLKNDIPVHLHSFDYWWHC